MCVKVLAYGVRYMQSRLPASEVCKMVYGLFQCSNEFYTPPTGQVSAALDIFP